MRILLVFILLIELLSAGNKIALLIGNQDYKNYPKLHTPINDVRAVKDFLKKNGFDTTIIENATRETTKQALYNFEKESVQSDIALIYYSGYGVAIKGENYLIPIDAPNIEYKLNQYELIPLKELTNIKSEANIILIDACRDISIYQKFQKGLLPIKAKENSIVTFSSSIGKTSLDTNEKHSLFGLALIENLNKNKEIIVTMQNVRTDVMTKSDYQQIPYIFNNLKSEKIYLKQSKIYQQPPKPTNEGNPKPNTPIASCNKHDMILGLCSKSHIDISEHSHIYITDKDEITQLENMKTFVLFPDNLASFKYQNSKEFKRIQKI